MAPACLCRPRAEFGPDDRAESGPFLHRRQTPDERRTLRWREPDSNHRSRLFKATFPGIGVLVFLACATAAPEGGPSSLGESARPLGCLCCRAVGQVRRVRVAEAV